jgi:hypothetical protein
MQAITLNLMAMKEGIVIFCVIFEFMQSIHGIQYPTERECRGDTTQHNEVELKELFLTIKFYYDKDNEEESDRIMQEQISFLKNKGLPANGLEEKMNDYSGHYKALDEKYEEELKNINNELYKKIYRQVVSQLLLKHINTSPGFYHSDSIRDSKIKIYLSEMKDSDGVNIELIYSSLYKIYKNKNPIDACYTISTYYLYAKSIIKRKEAELIQMNNGKDKDLDLLDQFIFNDLKNRLEKSSVVLNNINLLNGEFCK